jgi:hypothetical protein
MNKIWRTLPQDIVTQHIMPYTYREQPPQLLRDIRSYYADYTLVDEYYSANYNEYMWLNDIVCFFTLPHFHSTKNGVEKILKRHIKYKDTENSALIETVFDLYYKNIGRNIEPKIRFLWGLLLPAERAQFINKFLLEY